MIGTELEMVMGGDLCPWSGDFESPLIASFAADTPVDERKTHENPTKPQGSPNGWYSQAPKALEVQEKLS
ncbi:hypothetical protein MesoLj131b_45750 [Mesorhizobium sp. 131-2-5]|nr:hypothetical protein MesoLj131b_45750 [Mesorhizobium sp. 131-2-5]